MLVLQSRSDGVLGDISFDDSKSSGPYGTHSTWMRASTENMPYFQSAKQNNSCRVVQNIWLSKQQRAENHVAHLKNVSVMAC
jgi:hypothetical protein